MSRATQLDRQIETAIEDLRNNYTKNLGTVAALKKKANDLEQKLHDSGSACGYTSTQKLNLAVDELDRFIDSVISQASTTRQRCETLKLECSAQTHDPVRLKELMLLCSENEQSAKDLLCYSLGRLNK